MDDTVEFNGKLFGFNGFIGRRDYFLNLLYIQMICWLLFLPQANYIYTHAGVLEDFLNYNKLLFNAPFWIKLWAIGSAAALCVVKTGLSVRRLNDIFGSKKDFINIISSIIIAGVCFLLFMPPLLAGVFSSLYLILILFLLFKKGKVTKSMPYDYLKEFNWGAYFGTWIWGLFNSSYKTLWIIPLSFTPMGFYYAFICGLKGNEWAFKGKVWESLEKFRKSQETQTIVFTIITLIVLPLITFAISIGIVAAIFFAVASWDANTENSAKKLNKVVKNINSIYFESYKILNNENVFYINSSDWRGYSFSQKKKIFDLAARTAATERNAKNSTDRFSKSTELLRTKIYSSKNNELLAEFTLEADKIMESDDKVNYKEFFKAILTAYKFYNPKN